MQTGRLLLGFDQKRAKRAGLIFGSIIVSALALSAVFSTWMVQFGLPADALSYILTSMQIAGLVAFPLALFAAKYSYTIERYEQTLEAFASTDSLTGLLSQPYFEHATRDELRRMKYNGHQGAIAVFELVDFPELKDEYDEAAGNSVLRKVAGLAHSELRGPFDKLARREGASFIFLLSDTTLIEAIEVCERLVKRISGIQLYIGGNRIDVGSCFGVAHLVGDDDLDDIIGVADEAMLAARKEGINRVFSSIGRSERVRLALLRNRSATLSPAQ